MRVHVVRVAKKTICKKIRGQSRHLARCCYEVKLLVYLFLPSRSVKNVRHKPIEFLCAGYLQFLRTCAPRGQDNQGQRNPGSIGAFGACLLSIQAFGTCFCRPILELSTPPVTNDSKSFFFCVYTTRAKNSSTTKEIRGQSEHVMVRYCPKTPFVENASVHKKLRR